MMRTVLAMLGACLAAAIGQILVRRGMLQVGELAGWAPRYLVAYFWRALCNPWVIGGTVGNALFYFLFLGVLSWSEVSVALPLTALEYLMAALLGIWFLNEGVPPLRWLGIALVVAGVMVIGFDQRRAGAAQAAAGAAAGSAAGAGEAVGVPEGPGAGGAAATGSGPRAAPPAGGGAS